MGKSVVGIRASWQCEHCGAIEKTYQIVRLSVPEPIEPPAGWHVADGSSICRRHTVEPSAIGD